jgi:hypothetical protein
MKPGRVNIRIWIVTTLFTMLAPQVGTADGGIVQLRETQGPFLVTVFVSPEAVEGAVSDVSVLVQRSQSGDVVLNAEVKLEANRPGGVSTKESDPLCGLSPIAVASRIAETTLYLVQGRATREEASNKLLYAARLKLDVTGDWQLHVIVSQGTDTAGFDCLLPVRTSAKLARIWPYLAFPPIAIVVFATNQWLRRRLL